SPRAMALLLRGVAIAQFFFCCHGWDFGPATSRVSGLVTSNGNPVRCASRGREVIRFGCRCRRRLGTQSLITSDAAPLRKAVITHSFEALPLSGHLCVAMAFRVWCVAP